MTGIAKGLVWLWAFIVCASCASSTPASCLVNADCPSTQMCVDGMCTAPVPETDAQVDAPLDVGRDAATDAGADTMDAGSDAGEEVLDESERVEAARAAEAMPGLAVIAIDVDAGIVARGVAGIRRLGASNDIGEEDLWPLLGVIQPMTSALAASLVEDEVIAWGETVLELFPEMTIDPALQSLSLVELLNHRTGMSGPYPAANARANERRMPVEDERYAITEIALGAAPESAPREGYSYRRLNYLVAAAMMERAASATWEELVQTRILTPLGMTSCTANIEDQADNPWGHDFDAEPAAPLDLGPGVTIPPVHNPGLGFHCSLRDIAKFLVFQLRGARGEATLLRMRAFERLHRDPGYDPTASFFGYGWGITSRAWADPALNHLSRRNGFHSAVWMSPAGGRAYFGVANGDTESADRAIDSVVADFVRTYPPSL